MDRLIIEKLDEALKEGKKVAYVTITKSNGSAPGRVGDTMLVFEDSRIVGTCGGGKVEYRVITEALECLKTEIPKSFSYKLNEKGDLGMVCGGEIEGFIDVKKNDKNLLIIGCGHIGVKLYKLANELDFNITMLDDREEYASKDRFPNAKVICGDFYEVLKDFDVKDHYVITVTRGHATDYIALKELINKEYKYLGALGSKRKIHTMLNDLDKEGLNVDNERFFAPVGLDIAKNSPGEIALSILAEILLIKNNGSLTHMKRG